MTKQHSMTRAGIAVVSLALGAGLVGACERRIETERAENRVERGAAQTREGLNEMARGGGPTTSPASAIQSIASARCAREARCNNVGAGRRYESNQACLQGVRARMTDDLNLSDCPAGVDQRELSECLTEVRNEDCGNPLDTLGRLAACRSSDMCLHAPAGANH